MNGFISEQLVGYDWIVENLNTFSLLIVAYCLLGYSIGLLISTIWDLLELLPQVWRAVLRR